MGETIESRIAFLQSQVHAISLAVEQAKGRGDTATIDNLRALQRKIMQDIIALQQQARDADMPSNLLLTLDRLSDEAIAVGKQIQEATVDTVKGAATLVKALPIILLVAVIVVGLIYAGKIRKELK